MDTLQTTSANTHGRSTHRPFRLHETGDAGGGTVGRLRAILDRAEGLGFDAVLVPSPFHTERGLLADTSQADAWFGGSSITEGLATIASARRGLRLAVIADLPVDGLAAHSPLHRAHRDIVSDPDPSGLLDPRRDLDLARAPLASSPQAAEGMASLIAYLVSTLRAGGIEGVRLRRLSHIGGTALATIARAVRAAVPDALLIADTAGMSWAELDRIGPGHFDYVVASSAWWNWSDDWFFPEFDHLRRVASVLVPALSLSLAAQGVRRARLARDLGLAASLGAGWIVPEIAVPDDAEDALIRATNACYDGDAAAAVASGHGLAHLNGIHAGVLATLRTPSADPRTANEAFIALLNRSVVSEASIDPANILPAMGGLFSRFDCLMPSDAQSLVPGTPVTLDPGEFRLYRAASLPTRACPPLDPAVARRVADAVPGLALENPTPAVDGGLFPVKRRAGEIVTVEIDIIGDGHDKLGAAVRWRLAGGAAEWSETRLVPLGNDRWQASFPLETVGLHEYQVVAWRDAFATYRDELGKKYNAGIPVSLEISEGIALVDNTLGAQRGEAARRLREQLHSASDEDARRVILLSPELDRAMTEADPRSHLVSTRCIPVDAERTGAAFAAWYEVFPRSLSDDIHRHGTFRDVERHLPRIRDMGFDVLYFPPIHPVGTTNRKGPNNTLTPEPGDPGSPYAIGSAEGGHDALHPELGTFEDFRHLREAAAEHGLELAIDFAIQCSPDHPWLREHKDWFTWRPDGTIRYAENPPKKYQDIVNVDFYAAGSIPGLWTELAQVVLFWCEHGIRLFRVDNPHTKAFPFWQWMIGEVRQRYPDAAFLAEAFTRPKIMARLAKVGFSQSYTYFTWRNEKAEIRAYIEELADGPLRDYFRPHFFVNTPDINPVFLQNAGRAGFLIRAALAATLSGLWGVYNGFELCEATPLAEGKEEYLDSEKFQLRAWDWTRPGNIVAEITQLNAIRRANPALQSHLGVTFLNARSDAVLWYEKATPDRSNVLLLGVSLDPGQAHETEVELPLWRSGLPDHGSLALQDLISGRRFTLTGNQQSIRLSPESPYLIWRLASVGNT